MKKTKKLLACLIAAATMFTMGSTAFAAETVNKAQTPVEGKVQFTKEYKLIGEGNSPAETFNFTIKNAGVTDAAEGVNVTNMKTPTVGTVSYTKVDGATTDGNDKTVDVTLPDYTSVGVYTYTIKETAGTTAGVDYDAASVTMKVTVVNGDTAGTFKVAAVSFTKGDKKIENGEAAFNNTYTANKLAVSKEVTGNLGDKSKYFDFTITLTGKNGATYNQDGYAVTLGSYSKNPQTIKIGERTAFKLKHGDTITINNLPKDVTYTVEETAVSGYTTKVNNVKSNEAKGTTNSEKATQAFVNDKSSEIDTGVNLTTLPYILVFAGVIVIAGAAFITRRRKYED